MTGFIRIREKSGKNIFFKVRELSENFGKCQGNFEICKNVGSVREFSNLVVSQFIFFQRRRQFLHF